MKLRIEIELDNAAFEDGGTDEVARILEGIGQRIPDPLDLSGELVLHDANGNWCGYAEIIKGKAKRR